MLNVEQVEASPYVVTGTVNGDPAKGQVAVEREWKKHALSGTITVENLREAGPARERRTSFPLPALRRVPRDGVALFRYRPADLSGQSRGH